MTCVLLQYNVLSKIRLFVYTKLYFIRPVCGNIIDWIWQDFVAMKPIQTSGPFSNLNEWLQLSYREI